MKNIIALVFAVVLFAPIAAHAQAQNCSQPISAGPTPVASDCLFILNVAVGALTCTPECICAPTGTLPVKATDALVCLNAAVGAPVELNCPCGVTTSTTVSTTTTTVTLPPGDDDNDGIENADDPCPTEALNRCAGTIVNDGNTGRPIRLNAINPNDVNFSCRGQRIDCNGDVWEGDYGYNHQSAAFQCNLAGTTCDGLLGASNVFGCEDENTADIFRCEHFGSPNLTDLAYSFDVPDGSYIVNLLFANVYRYSTTVGARLFDVAIESQVVLDDFDQVAAAGGSGLAVNRSIIIDVTDGDGLQIEFIRDLQNPAIKGIEVLSVD